MVVDQNPLLIAITPELPVADEGHKISVLLGAGWHRVHLRHPQASRTDIRNIIESIPQNHHCRLILHGHFDLVNDFNLGGLHLNHRCPTPPSLYRGPLSKSCHSIEEIDKCVDMQYVTLSPVYDSISKQGYKSAFSSYSLKELDKVKVPVIALGGITPDNISDLKPYNFSGYAMLGSIPWECDVNAVKNFASNIYGTIV